MGLDMEGMFSLAVWAAVLSWIWSAMVGGVGFLVFGLGDVGWRMLVDGLVVWEGRCGVAYIQEESGRGSYDVGRPDDGGVIAGVPRPIDAPIDLFKSGFPIMAPFRWLSIGYLHESCFRRQPWLYAICYTSQTT